MSSSNEEIDPNSTRRKRFTEAEDARLKSLVKKDGIRNWEEIARRMPGRSSRQCRDRYNNYLFKEILHKPWTPEEDKIIIEKYKLFGPHWVKISQFLDARSGNNVKNRWHKYLYKSFLPQQENPIQQFPTPQIQIQQQPIPNIAIPMQQIPLQPNPTSYQPINYSNFPIQQNIVQKNVEIIPKKIPIPNINMNIERQKQTIKLPSIAPLITKTYPTSDIVNDVLIPKELQLSSLLSSNTEQNYFLYFYLFNFFFFFFCCFEFFLFLKPKKLCIQNYVTFIFLNEK